MYLFCRIKIISLLIKTFNYGTYDFQEIAVTKATAMFDQVDQDGDGELDEHEFIRYHFFNSYILFFPFLLLLTLLLPPRGCLRDPDFVLILNAPGVDPEEWDDE